MGEAGREGSERFVEVLTQGQVGECGWEEGKLVEATKEHEHLERGQGREWMIQS